jgi:hypothetical protein
MKGIAVETIIKVTLLVLVLSLVLFWLIKVTANKEISVEQCRSLLIDWCKNCVLKGWTGALPWGDDLLVCVNEYVNILGLKTPVTYAGACGFSDVRTECAKFGIT